MRFFQDATAHWLRECFPPEAATDNVERCDRFIEEAIELAQACGHTADRAHALVDYVYSRPAGETGQELGGTMMTLAALANAFGLIIDFEAWREMDRVREPETMAKIRAKQAAKPVGSALPIATAARPSGEEIYAAWQAKARAVDPESYVPATLPDALKMLDTWTPETFPAEPDGRIHFGRALLEAAADAIRQHLANEKAKNGGGAS